MDKSYLSQQRNRLKSTLSRRRIALFSGFYQPTCAICERGISTAPDMHEVFFTRGDVMKSSASVIAESIIGKNCVLVHPGGNASPCHAKAATKEGQAICIRHLVGWEGYHKILRWLQKMNTQMKGSQAKDAINLLEEVVNGNSNM